MKSLKCDLCDFVGQGETFEDWFTAMRAHYTDKHADWMKAMETKPGAKEEGEKWMAEAKTRFAAAQTIKNVVS